MWLREAEVKHSFSSTRRWREREESSSLGLLRLSWLRPPFLWLHLPLPFRLCVCDVFCFLPVLAAGAARWASSGAHGTDVHPLCCEGQEGRRNCARAAPTNARARRLAPWPPAASPSLSLSFISLLRFDCASLRPSPVVSCSGAPSGGVT